MTDTLLKEIPTVKFTDRKIQNAFYLLPKWEKVHSYTFYDSFFFIKKSYNLTLYKKFSLKNKVQKYSMKDDDGNVEGMMDLKVYKDCVYIIDINVKPKNFTQIMMILLKEAGNEAAAKTTDKKVYINLSLPLILKSGVKNVLKKNGFVAVDNQSKYEKEMFGEQFVNRYGYGI